MYEEIEFEIIGADTHRLKTQVRDSNYFVKFWYEGYGVAKKLKVE
jgi:hypothetical protein